MAAVADPPVEKPKGPSLVIQIGVLLGMTAAAIGLGWFSGGYLSGEKKSGGAAVHAAAPEHGGGEHGKDGEKSPPETLVELMPITTNLAAPSGTWVRMEASLVFDVPQTEELVQAIHQDFLAYFRTVKMHQIEGPSGFQHLKADLEERANIRGDGHIKQVLIRTLLFE